MMDTVLDMSVVEELLSFADDGDPELVLDLIQMFLDDGPTKVRAVVEGVQTGDFDRAERAAHSLKGSSGNLGAKVLSHICELLQVASRLKRPTEAQMLVPQLQTNYDAAEAALRSLQAKYQQQG
jgi:HPt (histidine-containing phosphotransfer) domain-containing protein